MYVLKFRGAGQGARALIAELISGELGRVVGLPVPEIVFAHLDGDLARTEPDPEIFALIRDSAGLNLALDYLPGSVMFDPAVDRPDPELASRIVWFDAYITNVDRSPRNTNMLMWHKRLWLIDHGASLYFHHTPGWEAGRDRSHDAFPMIQEHVLLRRADLMDRVDADMAAALTPEAIARVVDAVPDAWLDDGRGPEAVERQRAAYRQYLHQRLAAPRTFVQEATRAR
jgi:hypothetical protein